MTTWLILFGAIWFSLSLAVGVLIGKAAASAEAAEEAPAEPDPVAQPLVPLH